jgi:hypothetical protein
MKFKLTITKKILEASMFCGVEGGPDPSTATNIASGCAFAKAFNELVPNVGVENNHTNFYTKDTTMLASIRDIDPSKEDFIKRFDSLRKTPYLRLIMEEESFEVEIPDSVIEYWYQDVVEVAQKIADSPVLELID